VGENSSHTYPEMVFFIGLKLDVKINRSPLVCSIASSSLRPTTESGGMLQNHRKKETKWLEIKLGREYSIIS